jgi:hypothetical protein
MVCCLMRVNETCFHSVLRAAQPCNSCVWIVFWLTSEGSDGPRAIYKDCTGLPVNMAAKCPECDRLTDGLVALSGLPS